MLSQINILRHAPDITVVQLTGRLGMGSSGQSTEWKLQNLIGEGARKLVVDVAALTSIDSMGVGMLITIAGRVKQEGGEMKIAGAQGLVARTFEIVQLERVLACYPNVDAATGTFGAASGAAGA